MLSSTRRRVLVTTSTVAAVVVIGVAAFALSPDTSTTSTSDDTVEAPPEASVADPTARHARDQLHDEVGEFGRAVQIPAARATSVLSGLRPLVADAVVGTEGDGGDLRAAIAHRVERLHAAADAIEAAGDRTPPSRPSALPAPGTEPALARVSTIVEQAPEVADRLRAVADDADAATDAALQLNRSAAAYAGSTAELPDTDHTDELLAVWRAEQERLADYRADVEAVEHPAVADHAASHLMLVDELDAVATDAVAALEDEDVDTYNGLLDGYEDRLQQPIEELAATVAPTIDAAVAELESVEDRTLGFVAELEQLRDDATLDT